MLIKVKTLTGKEIEIDIDPSDKVRPSIDFGILADISSRSRESRRDWRRRKELHPLNNVLSS